MKSIINNLSLLLFAFVAIVSTTSCEKDHDHDGTGHMHIYFNNRYGLTEALDTNAVKTGTNNRDFRINKVQYYVSNVRLVGHDGNEVPFSGEYLLVKTNGVNELEMEELPTGHYTQLKFDVGVDSVTNHGDPSLLDAESDLSPTNNSGMFWSWNSGYIFFMAEGLVDTNATPNGTVDGPWIFHVGTDSYLSTVSIDIDKQVSEGSHPNINVYLNTAALFSNVDLGGADVITMTMNNMDLATRVKTNYSSAFTAE